MKVISYLKAENKYKIGAYDPCPCNSGEKYKFCCYKKSFETQPINAKKVDNEFKKSLKNSDFKECFGFDKKECDSTIVRAHSIQNNGVLSHIVDDNHVYQFDLNYRNDVFEQYFERIGRNRASTFFGFCSNHDDNYFKTIEKKTYQNTEENNYFYAFRALVHEMHKKKRIITVYQKMYGIYPQLTKELHSIDRYQNEILNLRDLNTEYLRYQEMYNQKDYSDIESFVLELPYKVGFAVSSYAAVHRDMKMEIACDVYSDEKKEVPCLAITVIPKEDSTLIIISRHRIHECYQQLFKQLKKESNINYLLKYLSWTILEITENIFFSIPIIDQLSIDRRKKLIEAYTSSLNIDAMMRLATINHDFNLFELLRANNARG